MNFVPVAIAVGAVALTLASIPTAQAQTPTFPPGGYSPLLFDAGDAKHVFRLAGVPWICRGDSFCKPVKVEGVADKDLADATIEPLGYAGARYFLTYKQANFEKGREASLSCVEERCSKLDAVAGDMSSLGTYQIKQGDRMQTRLALLRKLDARNGRAQLLWCTETGCAELPLTRDTEHHLALLGTGRNEGRSAAWLRDKSGAVLSCAQPEDGVSDLLACEKSRIVLGDFPSAAAPPMTTATPVPATSNADQAALSGSIDRALVSGDLLGADRLLADAMRRYPGHAAWPALQQKLARARTDRETQLRHAEARRLILEARRFADVGDFVHSEQMLQEADKQAPGFAETAQARAQIAAMRTERGQRYRERYQYYAAIDQAFTTEQLWEAERLLAEYAQRFNQDDEHRGRSARLAQLRAAGPYQARVNEARAHIARARQAMDRNDFVVAERELALADRTAPGHPEIAQARADLSRRRITAENQQADMRLLLAAIDMALQRKQYEDADRSIDEGRRRFGSYAGWTDLQTRAASARRGDDRQVNELRTQNTRALELVAAARRQTAQGDLVAADKSLTEAEKISPNLPEVAIARAEIERAKADHARQQAEIRAIAASADAAIARKQYADAERLIADGSKRYPAYGWGDLSRRLAEARRASPNQTGNAPTPAQPAPAPAPAQAAPTQAAPAQATPAAPAPAPRAPATGTTPPPPSTASPTPPVAPTPPPTASPAPPAAPTPPPTASPAPPAAPTPPPTASPAPPAGPSVARLVATAREAIRRSDFAAAEKAVAEAEKIDAKAASIVEVRAELKTAQEQAPDRREGRPRERAPGGGAPTRN